MNRSVLVQAPKPAKIERPAPARKAAPAAPAARKFAIVGTSAIDADWEEF
jgi:hypothetical protein